MGVHSNRYPNPTTVNENVNAGFESFSTVSLDLVLAPGYEGVGIWKVTFFYPDFDVSILFKGMMYPICLPFLVSIDNKKASSLKL